MAESAEKVEALSRGDSASAIDISIGGGANRYTAVDRNAPPTAGIAARRSGSNAVLVTNDRGEMIVERRNSDVTIAVRNRISASTLPSIIPLPKEPAAEPMLGAADALERTGGKGAAGAYSGELLCTIPLRSTRTGREPKFFIRSLHFIQHN